MNNKEKSVLQSLLKFYVDMYASKDLFNKIYFKYSPQDVENVINSLQNEKKLSPKRDRKPIGELISSIKLENEVESYYSENLQYNRNDKKAKEDCLKKITLDEFKYLYNILYTTPLRKNIRKSELLDLIEKYFASIDRAHSLKP
jgi:hypothetical protein